MNNGGNACTGGGCEYAPQQSWGADSCVKHPVAIRGRCRKWRLILLQGDISMLSHWMRNEEARCMSRCMSHQRFWLRNLVTRTFATGSLARQSLTRRRAFARPPACALPFWYTTGRRWPSLCSRCLLLLRLGGNHRSVGPANYLVSEADALRLGCRDCQRAILTSVCCSMPRGLIPQLSESETRPLRPLQQQHSTERAA